MRKVLFICFLIILTSAPAYCEDLMEILSKLESMKAQIQNQISQVQNARDRADDRIALAKERLYEDLVLAEEQLNLQIENAKGFLGNMPDQMKEAGEAAQKIGSEWKQAATSAYSNLEATTKQAQTLLQQLQNVRKSLDQVQTQSSSSSTTTTTQPSNTGQTGGCSSGSSTTTTTQPTTPTTSTQPDTPTSTTQPDTSDQ
jgi:chromosome segregation ATPase